MMKRRVAVGFAVAASLALTLGPPVSADNPLDPAHNGALPCEFVGAPHLAPRSAKNVAHLANLCGIVGTDLEFQSRTDARGKVHDFAFVGTMGQGTRIFDVTDPSHPFQVGGYTDPGWQNDVALRGNTMMTAFDPIVVGPHVSLCLRQKSDPNNSTANVTRGGVDVIRLDYDPVLNRFTTHLLGCYLNQIAGGSHTATLHPSGDWLAVNTSSGGVEVVDLRGPAPSYNRRITIGGSAHDVSFSRDGNTMYAASPNIGTTVVDVTGVLDLQPLGNAAATGAAGDGAQPPLIAFIPENRFPDGSANRYNVTTSHQADTSSDGKVLVFTDERGGGVSNTGCNTSSTGIIGGAHFDALAEIAGVPASAGASAATPKRLGTWFYPNPLLAADPLDPILASIGRTERACTIHVLRNGGNGSAGPGEIEAGFDGVSRLPTYQFVAGHYGAGVWWVDFSSAPNPNDGIAENQFTDWGNTLGWNVMPGADTWSGKEYKGYIYAGDMTRGFDVYSFTPCDDLGCIVAPTNVPGSASGGGGSAGVEAEFDIVKGVSVGGRATFGFDVAYRIGQVAPEGALSFTDHKLGKKIEATLIDTFHVAQGKATFIGRAIVDGVPGVRFEVVVQDNGEPGRNDTFQVFTADGYLASGTLGKGNVQVESDPNSIFSMDIG